MIVVGEASGDLHAARLVAALLERDSSLEVFGVAGENLRRVGIRVLLDVSQLTGMGFIEVVGNLGNLWRGYQRLRRALREERPRLLILIDFPEINLRLARLAKRLNVPVLYYISPQVWAWRAGRIKDIARAVDHMAVVFPFEVMLYERERVPVTFVGHPLLEVVCATEARETTLRRLGLQPGKPTVALLPGSRQREVAYHLPVMVQAARLLASQIQIQYVVVRASTVKRSDLEAVLARFEVTMPIAEGDTYDALQASDLVWTASGTATLEAALMLRPMIIVYRMSWVTYALARMLVSVNHIGMVNIIAGASVVPELIQNDVTPERIVIETRAILEEPERLQRIVGQLKEVRSRLGTPGAAGRVADLALDMMARRESAGASQ